MKAAFSLDNVRVASPCKASWDSMAGDDRVRACSACRMNVYNLSAMSRSEAADLIRSREGRTCVRFYRRSDGTMLTRDCPVGWRAWRRKVVIGVTAASVLFGTMLVTGLAMIWSAAGKERPRHFGAQGGLFQQFWNMFNPPDEMIMGEICPPNFVPPVPPVEEIAPPNVDG